MTFVAHRGRRSWKRSGTAKIVAKYTTQTILPSLAWLKTGLKASDVAPGELIAAVIADLDLCIGKTASGKVFVCSDKAPPTGTSLSTGGEVEGEEVCDPQFGSRWNVFTGEVANWCTSPPIIGGAVGAFMGGPQMIATFDCRVPFLGNEIEVLVDTNAKKAYEAPYWKGVLDAQGKDDGSFY